MTSRERAHATEAVRWGEFECQAGGEHSMMCDEITQVIEAAVEDESARCIRMIRRIGADGKFFEGIDALDAVVAAIRRGDER